MLKIIYAGTPEFALPALQALIAGEDEVVAVYTQPDRPAGRGRKLQPGPVKSVALEHRLPVYQPLNFADPADVDLLRGFDADLMVVAAYGLLLPSVILGAPRLGCINLHASLLPRWRGASPIQQAILAGDERTGISLMQMEPGLDSGPILASRALDIDGQWSAGDLHDRLAPLAAELLEASLGDIENLLARAPGRKTRPRSPTHPDYKNSRPGSTGPNRRRSWRARSVRITPGRSATLTSVPTACGCGVPWPRPAKRAIGPGGFWRTTGKAYESPAGRVACA